MKQVTAYAPYIIASGAILAAIYFLWYKPKRDEDAAKNAALQAAEDAKLTAGNPIFTKAKNMSEGTVQPFIGTPSVFNMN